jgi:hypothetical protein
MPIQIGWVGGEAVAGFGVDGLAGRPAAGIPVQLGGAPALRALFLPGRELLATVISVFGGRAVLAFGPGIRLEVGLQASLAEGETVRLRVAEAGADQILLRILDPALPCESTPRPGEPTLLWFPIPLPEGRSGWLQVRVDPEERRGTDLHAPLQRVALWWETPALGPVRVDLEAVGESLAARFATAAPAIRTLLQGAMTEVAERLTAIGFTQVQAGCRLVPVPPTPDALPQASRLDQRG